MLFYDKSAVALALADRALERVRALGLAPTPQAFAVWYAIYGERSQELSARVAALEAAAS